MKRKGLVRLLGIVLALMLPLSAMAQGAALDMLVQANADGKEIVTTITFEPGTALAADQVVADLSAATAIRMSKLTGGLGSFAISLSGVDVVAAQLRVQPEGIYVQSETLGQQPLYFSWEDMQKGIADAMRSSGADEASINQFNQSFMSGFQQGLAAGIAGMGESMDTAKAMTEEQIKQKITEMMDGDDGFVKWMESIQAKKVVTTGEFTLEGSDVADTKTEITVTKEDMAALYDVPYIQKQMATQIKAKDASLTDEQVQAKVAELVAEVKLEMEKSDAVAPMVFYTKGEDDLVAADIKFSGTFTPQASDSGIVYSAVDATSSEDATVAATDAPAVPTKVELDYIMTRKTLDNGKMYSFAMNVTQDDVKQSNVTGSLTKTDKNIIGTMAAVDGQNQPLMVADMTGDFADPKHLYGELAVTTYGTDMAGAVVLGFDQVVSDAAVDTKLSVSNGATVEAIKVDAANTLMGTLNVNTVVQVDSGQYTALKEATPDTSVQPIKMSQTELDAFMTAVQSSAMQTLYKILANLPPSVSALMGGTTTGN